MLIVRQIEVQRRGGLCSQYPVACLVADIIRDFKKVLDITYGEGRFYKVYRPRVLVGADVRVLNWVVVPDLFILSPAWFLYKKLNLFGLGGFDLIVVDPPFGKGHRLRPHYNVDNLYYSRLIIRSAFDLAEKLGVKYILVHYRDKYMISGWELLQDVEFVFRHRKLKEGKSWFGLFAKK